MNFDIVTLAEQALAASRFVVPPPLAVRVAQTAEETIRWEVFLGHLLDPAATRQTATFAAWHVFLDRAGTRTETPLISVYWHPPTETICVTRQILTHVFEAFEEAPGVIGTRPAQKWNRELVATIPAGGRDAREIHEQLSRALYLAVVGISRLPITSLESPLPAFSLGELSYFPVDAPPTDGTERGRTLISLLELTDTELAARALEFALRGAQPPDVDGIVARLASVGAARAALLVRTVFNQAALAPYTEFATRLVQLVERLASEEWFGTARAMDQLAFMLRLLCRHLTAFDLSLFHNFGANYPDALFLDVLLKTALRVVSDLTEHSQNGDTRLLRRGIRAAALLRRHYEGLRVPDVPTSMGENARVLPAPFLRVPDEQITELGKRRRQLFSDDPTDALFDQHTRPILQQSFDDLDDDRELRELGTALFLDRPLGVLKQPGEVDRTPLISYVAFSRLIVRRRLATAKSAGWIDAARHDALLKRLAEMTRTGLAVAELRCIERPGVVSLADATKAAADFEVLHSTRSSHDELLQQYDWQPLLSRFPGVHAWLHSATDVLFLQQRGEQPGSLPRFELLRGGELQIAMIPRSSRSTMASYNERAGAEVLTPLAVILVRDETGELLELAESEILILAK